MSCGNDRIWALVTFSPPFCLYAGVSWAFNRMYVAAVSERVVAVGYVFRPAHVAADSSSAAANDRCQKHRHRHDLRRLHLSCEHYHHHYYCSIVISMSVCLSVSISPEPNVRSPPKLLRMLPASMDRFYFGGVAIRYVLPVLWMASYLYTIGRMGHVDRCRDSE